MNPAKIIVLLAASLLLSPSLSAQSPGWDPQELVVSREALTDLRSRLEQVAASPAYSSMLRQEARRDADRIRERLQRGDFQVGDRVVLEVEGEAALSDTVAVEPGPVISLSQIGAISLEGVLRSELEEHLTTELGRFLRQPRVRASALIRLSIQGAVGRPGFYTVPADILVSETLMLAGGPGGGAMLEDLRIERRDQRIWGGEDLQEALVEGRTLDQLGLRAGDQLVVPEASRGRGIWGQFIRVGIVVASTLLLGFRVFPG